MNSPFPYDTVTLLQHSTHYSSDMVATRKNQVKQLLQHGGPCYLIDLMLHFGMREWDLTWLGVHFLAAQHLKRPTMSPYSLDAKEASEHRVYYEEVENLDEIFERLDADRRS